MRGREFNSQKTGFKQACTDVWTKKKKKLFSFPEAIKDEVKIKAHNIGVKSKSSWIFHCKAIRLKQQAGGEAEVRRAEHSGSVWLRCCSHQYRVRDRLSIRRIHVLYTPSHMFYIIYSWGFRACTAYGGGSGGELIAPAERWKMIATAVPSLCGCSVAASDLIQRRGLK